MRTITNEQLIQSAQKAWDDNRLACQHNARCLYEQTIRTDIGDHLVLNCGIGAALTRSELDEIDARDLNDSLTTRLGIKNIVRFEDSQFAEALQEAHDDGHDKTRKYFRQMIGR